jgi:sec-independent protein translocase protein TatA
LSYDPWAFSADHKRELKLMGIGMRELVVILLVVLLVFGAKKLRTIGSDLGAAVRGFKKSMNDGEEEELHPPPRRIPADGTDAEFAEAQKAREPSQKSDRSV